MKKGIILSAIALCLLALPGKAQEPVRSVEFEMGFGSGAAIWLGKSCASLEFKMELRCNLPHPHWDLGMYFAVAEAVDGIQYDKANDQLAAREKDFLFFRRRFGHVHQPH